MEETAWLSRFFHIINYIISVLYDLYYPWFEWGSRGRWFDSSHSDHPKALKSVDDISLLGVFLFSKPSTVHYSLIVLACFFC